MQYFIKNVIKSNKIDKKSKNKKIFFKIIYFLLYKKFNIYIIYNVKSLRWFSETAHHFPPYHIFKRQIV